MSLRRDGGFIYLLSRRWQEKSYVPLRIFPRHLHTDRRILHRKLVQSPPVLLALKSVCVATTQPLFRASRDKRYNTLDFLRKSCATKPPVSLDSSGQGERRSPLEPPCQQGAARPYWMTQGRTNWSWCAMQQKLVNGFCYMAKEGVALLWKPPTFSG